MSWKSFDALPVARQRHDADSWRDFLYVVGGCSDTSLATPVLSVLKSRCPSEGPNTPWVSCAPDMKEGKIDCGVSVLGNGWLMIAGGRQAGAVGAETAQDVYLGKFDADGNIPFWSEAVGAIPVPLTDMGIAVKDNFVFLIGGKQLTITLAYNTQTGNFTVGTVVTGGTSGAKGTIVADADAGATGTLTLTNVSGTFQAAENITDTATGAAKAAAAQVLVQTSVATIYRARFDNFGTLSPFVQIGLLPAAITPTDAVTILGDKLIVTDTTSMYSARIMAGAGEIGPWTTTPLASSAVNHVMGHFQEDLLILGGYDGANVVPSVWATAVDSMVGLTEKWGSQSPLITEVQNAAIAQIGNRVFVIGGLTNTPAVTGAVQSTVINSSGQI